MRNNLLLAGREREKDSLLNTFTDTLGKSIIAQKIASLHLSSDQQAVLKDIVDDILVDTFYTLLLGLDGGTSMGGIQITYKIHDEEGNIISARGEIEAEAWEQFHGDNK